jgi:hypothetical protein
MIWRYVDSARLKGIQAVLLGGAILLGVIFIFGHPNLISDSSLVTAGDGIGLIAFGVMGALGEVWISRGTSPRRLTPSFLAHTGLTALFCSLSAALLLNTGHPDWHGLQLVCATLFGMLAWVNRAFVHWRSHV